MEHRWLHLYFADDTFLAIPGDMVMVEDGVLCTAVAPAEKDGEPTDRNWFPIASLKRWAWADEHDPVGRFTQQPPATQW